MGKKGTRNIGSAPLGTVKIEGRIKMMHTSLDLLIQYQNDPEIILRFLFACFFFSFPQLKPGTITKMLRTDSNKNQSGIF